MPAKAGSITCCVLTWLLVYFCIPYRALCSYLVVGVLLHPVSCVVFLPGCWCTFASHIVRCVLTWLLVYFCIPYRVLCSYLVVGVLLHPISCVVFLPGCWCTFASHIMCCVLTWLLVYFCIPLSLCISGWMWPEFRSRFWVWSPFQRADCGRNLCQDLQWAASISLRSKWALYNGLISWVSE